MQGYEQVSRKYCRVARLPEGMTGRRALEEASGEAWAESLSDDSCADQFRRVYAGDDLKRDLTPGQFLAFLETKATASWKIDWPFEPDEAPPMFGRSLATDAISVENCGNYMQLQARGVLQEKGVRTAPASASSLTCYYYWYVGNYGVVVGLPVT